MKHLKRTYLILCIKRKYKVNVKITNITPYGAFFVGLKKADGLIHISEISDYCKRY
ncbi:S1 RNA-binding domain-containing protein [Spiroplasma poulsonii]|uniref:S1 RNA-binding domain-containing protein n=1 Tax=Spiroplasma poulsonii TaxID=2138 RepID=UPI0038D51504